MTCLVGQRGHIDVGIEEVLCLEVGVTERAVEVADQAAALLRLASRQRVVQARLQPAHVIRPEGGLEGVVFHRLRAGDIPTAGVTAGFGRSPVSRLKAFAKFRTIGKFFPSVWTYAADTMILRPICRCTSRVACTVSGALMSFWNM